MTPGYGHENFKAMASELEDAHNTLARRAEIGRLVEAMAVNGNSVRLSEAMDMHGPHRFTAEFHGDKRFLENGETLLDALRALAKECQLPEKP